MPIIKIETNQEISEPARQGFMEKASALTAKLFGKTEHYVMVVLDAGKSMMFGGGTGPTALVSVTKIALPVEKCPELTQAYCAFLEEDLGISPDRVFIDFADIDGKQLGWNNKTIS